jgi:TolB protein
VWSADEKGSHIWIMRADGTHKRQLTSGTYDFNPCCAVDGYRIFFQRYVGDYKNGNYDIFVMNADGSNPENLTRRDEGDTGPANAPDGLRVAFTSGRRRTPPPARNAGIWMMTRHGEDLHELTADPIFSDMKPTWSPGGGWIAFTRVLKDPKASRRERENAPLDIWILHPATLEDRNLTNSPPSPPGVDNWLPSWGP